MHRSRGKPSAVTMVTTVTRLSIVTRLTTVTRLAVITAVTTAARPDNRPLRAAARNQSRLFCGVRATAKTCPRQNKIGGPRAPTKSIRIDPRKKQPQTNPISTPGPHRSVRKNTRYCCLPSRVESRTV